MNRTLPAAIQDLIKPGAIPGKPGPIKIIQTQMSWILITGKHVYKMKKPVNLGYVDYTTLEKRRYYCHREVELNRRLCPRNYLGVSTVNLHSNSYCIDCDGEVADYAVKMKKLPAEKMLDHLLEHGNPTPEMLHQVGARIARFHQEAETGPHIDPFGSLESIRFNAEENFTQSRAYAGRIVSPETLERIERFSAGFINNHIELFESRVQEGRIRDCHGDLHSSHICFTDELCIYDCIEFNDRFRYSDTASEIAFLAMDLDHYGRADLSQTFIQRYLELTEDYRAEELMKFYKCYRAMVRAKVNCFKLDDPYVSAEDKRLSGLKAKLYFDLAESYTTDNPWLLINVGLTGSGKSTLAKALACHLGMVVVSSDITRKQLAGIPPTQSSSGEIDTGIYSPDFSRLTYENMFKEADKWLKRGVSVILDGTFTLEKSRGRARETAETNNAGFCELEYKISDEEACRRIERRQKDPGNVSDGTAEVYFKMKREFEPLDENEKLQRVIIESTGTIEEHIASIQHYMYNH